MPIFSHSDQSSLRAVFLRDMMLVSFLCDIVRNDTALIFLNLRVAQRARPDWIGLWATWFGWRCPRSLQGCWTTWPLKVPFNPNCSMILWFHNYTIWPINDFSWMEGSEHLVKSIKSSRTDPGCQKITMVIRNN